MGLNTKRLPKKYLCEICKPRVVDKTHAINLQAKQASKTGLLSSQSFGPPKPMTSLTQPQASPTQQQPNGTSCGPPLPQQAKKHPTTSIGSSTSVFQRIHPSSGLNLGRDEGKLAGN